MQVSSVAIEPLQVYFAVAVAKALHCYSRRDELLYGFYRPESSCLHMIPLAVTIQPDSTVSSLILDLASKMASGMQHSNAISIEDLSMISGATPLLRVAFTTSETADEAVLPSGGGALVDLCFKFSCNGRLSAESSNIRELSCYFNSNCYTKLNVERFVVHIFNALKFITSEANSNAKLLDIPLLSGEEYSKVMNSFCHSQWRVESPLAEAKIINLVDIVLYSAKRFPNKVAVECPTTGISLTFSELDSESSALATRLRRFHEINVSKVVAIAAVRSVSTIISLLSVVKSGCAYVPMDSSFPAQRLAHMIEDASLKLILCPNESREMWKSLFVTSAHAWPSMPEIWGVSAVPENSISGIGRSTVSKGEVDFSPDPSDTAAILYTSGSTGVPKGVVLSHKAMVQQYMSLATVSGLVSSDRVAQNTTLTFDVAGNEIWGSLLVGATLVIVDDATRLVGFERFISLNSITTLFITPSHLSLLDPSKVSPSLRTLAVAGEAVTQALVSRWATRDRLFLNEYGPTEADVVSMYPCTAESAQGNVEKAMAPIGFPTPRAILRILDPALRPVPIGIPGELCIAGSQLADGYFRNPSLTDAKFVHAHFSAESTPERLYRSGDLCRWRSDGCIEYLGRIDRQV